MCKEVLNCILQNKACTREKKKKKEQMNDLGKNEKNIIQRTRT